VNKNKRGQGVVKSNRKKNVEFLSKKDWFDVKSPKDFGEKVIGKTLVNKTNNISKIMGSLKNRNYRVTLNELKNTDDPSHKQLTLRCHNSEEKICTTIFYGLDTSRDKFFSLIRRWQTLIEINSDVKTKDGYFLRIFLVTFSRKRRNQVKKTSYIKSSQVRSIRRKMEEILIRETTSCTMKDLIPKLISEKLVDEIGFSGSKIFPLQNVIIKKVKLIETPL